jgi:hemolysin activation/secretion protein
MSIFQYLNVFGSTIFLAASNLIIDPVLAQTATPNQIPERIPTIQEPQKVPSILPQKEEPILEPPSVETIPHEMHEENQLTFRVKRFVFEGNTIFNNEQLETVVDPFTRKEITLSELLEARTAITNFYVERGYITSGAFLPVKGNQTISPDGAVVTIQIVEGKLEKINIIGSSRLQNYILSRLPSQNDVINKNRLLEALHLLQLDPLFETISSELREGSSSEKSLLELKVKERNPFRIEAVLDNYPSPASGSFQRRVELTHANLLGLGDKLSLGYRNTNGSNTATAGYSIPINSQNGTVQFFWANSSVNIIEFPFNSLDIVSDARAYELTFRQPILRKATNKTFQEFALGVTASRLESESSIDDIPYPLTSGADSQGRTRISVVRFFQEWIKRDTKGALLLRSQFNLGIGVLDATLNNSAPDGRFFSWQGQAAWLRRLTSNTTLVARANLQFADSPLAALEQISLGGATTVRGYRENSFVTDNGFLLSTELRITAWAGERGELQVIPFFNFGTAWNNDSTSTETEDFTGTLASVGLGLLYQLGDRFNARLDWGVPLFSIDTNTDSRTWQENGVYFSIGYRLF